MPKVQGWIPIATDSSPAMVQLIPPAIGPNRIPVRGARTHPNRKKVPGTPIVGEKGIISTMRFNAANTETRASVRGERIELC